MKKKDLRKEIVKALERKKITTIKQAIDFLEKKAGISVTIHHKFYKYSVGDNDFEDDIETDKDLIDYANEQKEAIDFNMAEIEDIEKEENEFEKEIEEEWKEKRFKKRDRRK